MNISIPDYLYSTIAFNTRVIRHVQKLSTFTYNWYAVIPFVAFRQKVTFKLKNGKQMTVSSYPDYYNLIHHNINEHIEGMKYGKDWVMANYKGKQVYLYYEDTGTKNKAQLLLQQNFIGENNKSFKVRGKTIVDIGSAIADTPILFALNGARHVFGFEPEKQLHRLAKRNIKANKLEKQITLINSPATSIGALDKYKADILKIDCEGCEYNLIMNASKESLGKYSEIFLEYHYGYKDLVVKLKESGFKVTKTRPIRSYNLEENKVLWLGSIYATKKNPKAIKFQ
jgi:precorrin-6B methylase 2